MQQSLLGIARRESEPSCARASPSHFGIDVYGWEACGHYLLPMRREGGRQTEPDGRYADDAMALFMSELSKTGTWPVDYDVKMFGGGDQFPDHAGNMFSVPDNNILVGRQLLQQLGFTIKAEHLGGTGHRNVIFDVWSGKVWIKHVSRHQSIRNHA